MNHPDTFMDNLGKFVKAWCAEEERKRQREETLRRLGFEINWLQAALANPQRRMSAAQRGEYRHQIRHHEIEIALIDLPRR